MNTHESYVSLEVAKLLKEAGFDWEVNYYFRDNNEKLIPKEVIHCFNNQLTKASTLAVVQKWLREIKGYELWVYPFSTHYRFSFYGYLGNEDNDTNFDTYEEALEVGIKKCLEIILKEE